MILENNDIQVLSANEIAKLAEFVVRENFKHHTNNDLPKNYYSDVKAVYEEELSFQKNSSIYASKDINGNIEGTIRVLKWNYSDILPIEKIFKINPLQIAGTSPLKSIWHIGRFAIKKECKDINLFKRLMICAIAPICNNKNAVAFAECDSKLLRVLRALGIKAITIGEPVNYLGSETIPICMNYEGLIDFYNNNKHLVENNIFALNSKNRKLHQRVVIDNQITNYTLV